MPHQLSQEFLALQEAVAGRYSLEHEIARGGMGIVFLARDVALDRPVAIKLLQPALAAQPKDRERFLREARTAAGLSHPNIVPIHAVEEQGELVLFVMGYVEGETLGERVERIIALAIGPLDGPGLLLMLAGAGTASYGVYLIRTARKVGRLAITVAALENIRLDLLRLKTGVGSLDDLTADLETAREVGADVDAELEARREAAALVSGERLNSNGLDAVDSEGLDFITEDRLLRAYEDREEKGGADALD